MTKHWKHPVICSHITAKLVLLKIRCDAKYLTALPLNQPEVIENVEVTLLDANHCPGSVMFLFKVNWRNSHRSSWRIPKTSGFPGWNSSKTHFYDNLLDKCLWYFSSRISLEFCWGFFRRMDAKKNCFEIFLPLKM